MGMLGHELDTHITTLQCCACRSVTWRAKWSLGYTKLNKKVYLT